MKLDKETGREQFEDVKEWLRRYRYAVDDVRALQLRVETLRDKMMSISSPIWSDMPKGNSTDPDKIGKAYSIVDEAEKELLDATEHARMVYREINDAIRQIRRNRTAEIRLVMQLRYLDLTPWDEVAFVMYGDKEDFYDRESTYTRKCHAFHRQGLELLKQIIDFEETEAEK